MTITITEPYQKVDLLSESGQQDKACSSDRN
jgi:hypothetical protein